MHRVFFSFLLICSAAVSGFAQSGEILLTIGGREISREEFEYIYRKNNNNVYSETDKKTPEEYLPLFIDFKLKVIEAENLKMDTSRAFIDELAGYRNEIAAHYLTDIDYEDELVQKTYDRMKTEVDASHILLRLEPNATPTREREVLEKIKSIRQEIINGLDFGDAAVKYSEDPSAQENRGHLGYFTAFMMVYPFENAAFTTPVGEISEPVRTQFGYHILKVDDVRPNQGEILVAHIMKNIPADATEENKAQLKVEIDGIYEQLKNGADFAELAKKESDDKRSAVKGGEMPWFSSGRIIPEFSIPAFALKNIGDISEPIETAFGYHIIKKLDEKPVPPYEELSKEIETRISRDPERRTSSRQVFIQKLKEQYNFSENETAKIALEAKQISAEETLPDETLFTIDGKEYSTTMLQSWALKQKNVSGPWLSVYDLWVDDEIIALEDSKLEDKYPDFRYLIKEYHDGILLFNISQEKIWNFAGEDTVGLEAFYASMKEKDKPMWGERFKGTVLNCKNEAVREEADKFFESEIPLEEIAERLNTEEEVFTWETGAWEKGENPVVDYYVWNGDEPADFNSLTTFVRGDKMEPEPKTLDEARGIYISNYQQYLEQKWLKELHSKYKVKVNRKLLKKIEGV